MRRIGILCLFLPLLVQLVEAAKDDTRLRVSIRKEPLQTVSSCVHAFSQVELLNLDETEPIVIHSVELTEEEIVSATTKDTVLESVGQQIFISSLSEVTLGPKQNAIIPMTFVPRFPEVLSSSEPVETTSNNNNGRRNNVGYSVQADEFQITTNIVLETSRGVLRLPVEASSIRQNGYRLPEAIHFRSHGEQPTESPTIQGGDDCYDVHMSNPFQEKSLQIFDVVVSRPDLIKMYHREEEVSDTAVTALFRNWQDKGEQRSIAPDVKDEYVITLCPRSEGESTPEELKRKGGLSRTSDMNDGLGYLQIRTNTNVFVVNLEEREVIDPVPTNVENVPNVAEPLGLRNTTEEIRQAECASNNDELDPLAVGTAKVLPASKTTLSLAVTGAPQIEIQLVPYANPSFVKIIELRNSSPFPLKVKQTSVMWDFEGDAILADAVRDVGLTVDATVGKRNPSLVAADPQLMEDAVVLSTKVSPTSSGLVTNKPLRFTGAVHVSATADLDSNGSNWSENVKKDPDQDLSMEIPFAINVLHRQVHIVMDYDSPVNVPPPSWKHEMPIDDGVTSLTGLFYPMRRTQGPVSEILYNSTAEPIGEQVTYRIGFVSPVGRAITGGKLMVEATNSATSMRTTLCRRFLVSDFVTYPNPQLIENSSFYYLGKATLTYAFDKTHEPIKSKKIRISGKDGFEIDSGLVLPETCHLQVMEGKGEEGRLTVPLIVFPGKLDFTVSDNEMPTREMPNPDRATVVAPSIISGFDEITSWLRSFGMGAAMKKVLKTLFNNRMNDGPTMLAGYIAGLAHRRLFSGTHTIRPILLNAGSVVHGEVQSFPLYLANHNPVPVEVSIDVGEVEGMSISVSRESSHGKGDGNSLLDRIPKEETIKASQVSSGRWKGHSRRGLKRFLVVSSEFPQAVSSYLPYRDDISLSPAAVEVQPILRTLYKDYDVGKFYADSAPRHLHYSDSSGCPGLDLDPPEYLENSTRIEGLDPFIISDRLSVSRSLTMCRDMKNVTESHASRVTIPPGGAARFEFKVRSPSRELLKSDITNFLGTGLVLSTDYGQVIPVFVSFEALLGTLQLSTPPSPNVNDTATELSNEETIIDVPPGLFLTHEVSGAVSVNRGMKQRANASVPLFVNSTFAREVVLNKVESCNPWFDVSLSKHEMKNETPTVVAGEKLEIGWMESAIPCRPFHYEFGSNEFRVDFPTQYPRFPSFYECTLEWLQNRFKLQPRGCGLSVIDGGTTGKSAEDDVLSIATETLKKAVHYSLIKFNDGIPRRFKRTLGLAEIGDSKDQAAVATSDNSASSTRKRPLGPYIERKVVDLFAQLDNAWRRVTESGLNVVSSNLRAQIGYSLSNSTEPDQSMTQTLSVVMRDVAIRTSLDMPTLVDTTLDDVRTMKIDGTDVSVVQFPGTRVADVASMTIPLRNPTSVPVRVRLGALSTSQNSAFDEIFDDVGVSVVSSDIRDGYLGRYRQVYVQSERASDQPIKSDADYWWEGGGTFVLPDDRGDLIQSRYNTSITAGPGAHISLINPSVHAFNGISMRCGERCGVRDDAQAQNDMHFGKHYSPIGASSAAGSTLMGRPRPQTIPLAPDDRHLGAGGSTPMDSAHLAFAIPYSSLDEIVLPPYGTGELGPILFRPPGRHGKLGCGASVENNIDGTDERSCDIKDFESLFFLENSLTGLERVVVRGEGVWESVALLDPIPSESSPYGNVEHRYGRSTLVFPGSAGYQAGIGVVPVRKEVVVYNNGDVPVEFERVHFTQAPDLRLHSPIMTRSFEWNGQNEAKVPRNDDEGASSCQRRGFRLLNCSEDGGRKIKVNGKRMINLAHGFSLDPGQNISLYVEHYPDCAFNSEYVALHLDYLETNEGRSSWSPTTSRSRNRAVPNRNKRSKARNVELLVGFEMEEGALADCVSARSIAPWGIDETRGLQFTASSGTNTTDVKSSNPQTDRSGFVAWLVSPIIRLAVVCSSTVGALWVMKGSVTRNTACRFFWTNFYGTTVDQSTNSSPPQTLESDWPAAFRCLARTDPSSSDLQAVGREQARQLVLDRYRSVGAITPHCISSAGVFMRDRSGVASAGGRTANGNERKAMTFSDSVFRGAFTDQGTDSEVNEMLPCSLGWRAASSKGLVQKTSRNSKSKQLLAERKATMSVVDENGVVEDESKHEYTSSEQESPVEPEEDSDDEHKGDVVSTSESEGTAASVVKGIDGPLEGQDVDLSGFAKVGSKGKSSSREKNRNKKASEARAIRVSGKKTTARKNTVNTLDAPQVLVYRKDPSVTTSPKVLIYKKEPSGASHARENVNNAEVSKSRVPVHTNTTVVARTKSTETSKPRSTKTNSKQVAVHSVPPAPLDDRTIGMVGSPMGMRSMSSVGSSAPSSPSVSISSRSTSKSDKNKNAVRPPPGLAPPPGFTPGKPGKGNEAFPSSGSIDGLPPAIQRVSSSDGLPPMVPSLYPSEPSSSLSGSADLLEPSFSGNVVETRTKAPTSSHVSEHASSAGASPVLTSQVPLVRTTTHESQVDNSGFDVMDFLDDILAVQEPLLEEEEEESNTIGNLLADKPASSSMRAIGVSSDPWATERKSRASAYGIHVDPADEEEDIVYAMLAAPVPTSHTNGNNASSSSLHNSVPLLTPSAMLAANQAAESAEDGEKVPSAAPLFNRGSFYSSLLKE